MTRFARGLIFAGFAALAVSAYAASGDTAAVPATGATESIPPANPPAQPAVTPPSGFPPLVVPLAIADPAREVEPQRFVLERVTEAHALHAAAYRQMTCDEHGSTIMAVP